MCLTGPIDIFAGITLAELIKKDLGVEVCPVKLADFIDANWEQVARSSHAIHNYREALRSIATTVEGEGAGK